MANFMNSNIPKKVKVAISVPGRAQFEVVSAEKAVVSVFDRSFHFGDSVYEVVRTYEGVLFGLKDHFARLRKSMELALWEKQPDFEMLEGMLKETVRQYCQEYGFENLYVRITVSRGVGDTNIDPTTSGEPYAVVIAKALPDWPEWHYTKGVEFSTVNRRRNSIDALSPAIKSGNYLNNVLAIVEAKNRGGSDALMLNASGFVTEGTTNNIFAVKNGSVWTPSLDAGILDGITRKIVLRLCTELKIDAKEKLFTLSELLNSQEVFLSSTTREIVPITKIDGQKVSDGLPGTVTQKLHAALRAHIDSEVKNNEKQ